MTQTPLTLEPHAATVDRTGFDIGWDHAHHGLVPPTEWLLADTPVAQGWRAGKAVYGQRTLGPARGTRAWLALRLHAWHEGIAFEGQQLTAHHVAQLQVNRCPVLRTPLAGSEAVIARLNPQAGYAAGNVALMSRAAADALAGTDVLPALRHAQQALAAGAPVAGLDAAAWWRVAALRSFATALPFTLAARLPLAVLPPNRVRLLNAVQGLQALLTMQFAAPGWSARTRAVAELLPQHTLRHDWHLFVGAIAPRVMEAADGVRPALEDAWLNERVQRRWQHFVLSLGEAGAAALLDRVAAAGVAGVRTLQHGEQQATDGWQLGHPRHAPAPTPAAARQRAPAPWSRVAAPRRALLSA